MKTILTIVTLSILSFLKLSAQTHEIVYGDPKYMTKVFLIVGESKSSLERYVLNDKVEDGTWKIYHDKEKKHLKTEGRVVKGRKEGTWKSYSKNGALSKEAQFKNGQLHGTEKYYNQKTGEVMMQYSYKGGQRDGYYFVTHANGQKWQDGYFIKGAPNGKWNYWDKKGKLLRTTTYSGGVFVKEEKF